MGMPDLSFSMELRDILKRMIREFVDSERPRYRYAQVESIDRPNRKCAVVYNGETGSVLVNMGALQPSAVGQYVRIEGIGTDKFVADVIGEPYYPAFALQTGVNSQISGLDQTLRAHVATLLGKVPDRVLTGRQGLTTVANTPTRGRVNFPSNYFSVIPTVVVSPLTSSPGSAVIETSVTDLSAAGFDAVVYRNNASYTDVEWVAIQMTG